METLTSLLADFTHRLAVLIRVSAFFVAIPLFGQGVPTLAKVGLAGVITLLVAPSVAPFDLPDHAVGYTLLIAEEALIGLAMGLVVTVVITAIYLGGQLIDVPIGFSMVNVIDPQTGMQVPIVAQFKFLLAMLILFVVDGHHALLGGVAKSFQVVPIGLATMNPGVAQVGVETFGTMFVVALRIALPLVAALFLADVALGIVARAVPQINVFFVGIPLKIAFGLVMLVLVMPVFARVMAALLSEQGEMMEALVQLLRALTGTSAGEAALEVR